MTSLNGTQRSEPPYTATARDAAAKTKQSNCDNKTTAGSLGDLGALEIFRRRESRLSAR